MRRRFACCTRLIVAIIILRSSFPKQLGSLDRHSCCCNSRIPLDKRTLLVGSIHGNGKGITRRILRWNAIFSHSLRSTSTSIRFSMQWVRERCSDNSLSWIPKVDTARNKVLHSELRKMIHAFGLTENPCRTRLLRILRSSSRREHLSLQLHRIQFARLLKFMEFVLISQRRISLIPRPTLGKNEHYN